ncbi:phosphogluconate dehydratase [Gilliamella apicola]|uniref:phosphogluconate dehydratase n=1 Tax=Gilliamella apicola TaxID=1196095 RepID=UPI000A32EF17|nr:phosphogluconate dehydratase [Gilliamella apicola]OTP90763.1 phosphogluconate dehydratase [Gilliamella apicola]OTP96544.1 phosphogluconate dehydratase [Gilliamella apicola]OTP97532.1 phosphogluconate dehydratase [Gilliamella apicola]OTQ03673.1 phosphogluconate dehydratase [Gilliamella apicola]OTQ07047.1 phosphogluconate dehydratase [Gilliamella apicola]
MNPTVKNVTQRIIERSKATRTAYLQKIEDATLNKVTRSKLPCSNLAHGFAACCIEDKNDLKNILKSNIGIISSYNDMLSAHKPYELYPEQIRKVLNEVGAVGQMAGGVPAMCDGVTQGEPGMELSLISRDIIAMSVAVGLSHNMFDGALYLGICDKIVPGLLVGALTYGHLPAIFVPAGPMPSGLSNKEKVRIRQLYSEGKASREDLLESEAASYHSSGTCTFYGTANSNQMVIELMGLHLPGSAFVNPETTLRFELTNAAAKQITRLTKQSGNYMPIGKMVDERVIVNGLIALLATGGSTNLTMHIVAIAKAAGIIVNWDDISDLSTVVPLLCRIYPNGPADINYFQAAGGTSLLVRELLEGGLLHEDVETVVGRGLSHYIKEPILENGKLIFREGPNQSLDENVITSIKKPFNSHGGLKVMSGNIGRAVMKTSAIAPEHQIIEAPAVVFNSQYDLDDDYKAGKLDKNCVVVVRYQGPKAIGMPELHKLITPLGVLQDRGYKVALLTDGRLSGASGKVPAAIHVTPEAYDGGLLSKIKNGDMIRVNGQTGEITLLVDETELAKRQSHRFDLSNSHIGYGRELFTIIRENLTSAEEGAVSF